MQIISSAFKQGEAIPPKYTCDADNINPPLEIREVPIQTKTLALIVDDPDAPAGLWIHWILWNISPYSLKIAENSVPGGAVSGTTSFGDRKYGGPCPPSGKHRYFFRVYALDTILDLSVDSHKGGLEEVMQGHIIAQAELMGTYERE